MKKTILTAMLSFAFLFIMVVSANAQNEHLLTNEHIGNVSSKTDAVYLNNLPNFVNGEEAKFLLKTQIKANTVSITVNEANANLADQLQSENTLYNEVYQLIYREQFSVEDAVIRAYSSMLSTQTPPDVSGIQTQYANSSLFQDLVNLLAI